MIKLEEKTDKEISRRKFLGLLGKLGLAGAGIALSLGCGEEKPIKKEYPIRSVAKPGICESETKLELTGKFASPAIYCKDKDNRQIACSIDDYENGNTYTRCYVLGE